MQDYSTLMNLAVPAVLIITVLLEYVSLKINCSLIRSSCLQIACTFVPKRAGERVRNNILLCFLHVHACAWIYGRALLYARR